MAMNMKLGRKGDARVTTEWDKCQHSCVAPSATTTAGICQFLSTLPGEGQPCVAYTQPNASLVCAPGFATKADSNGCTCIALQPENAPCQHLGSCEAGQICASGQCQPKLAEDASCSDDEWCNSCLCDAATFGADSGVRCPEAALIVFAHTLPVLESGFWRHHAEHLVSCLWHLLADGMFDFRVFSKLR